MSFAKSSGTSANAEEIRTLATRGMTPGGAARGMQPLPDTEWAALERDLASLMGEIRAAVERHAASMLAGHERTATPAATRRWIAVLLGRAADMAMEFEPDHIGRRFGELEAAEAADLRAVAERLKGDVERLLARCQGES